MSRPRSAGRARPVAPAVALLPLIAAVALLAPGSGVGAEAREAPGIGPATPAAFTKAALPGTPAQLAREARICTQPGVRALLSRYVRSVNAADPVRLRRLFSTRVVPGEIGEDGRIVLSDGDVRGFRWYSVLGTDRGLSPSARRGVLARSRRETLRYLEVRAAQNETLRLVAITAFQRLEVGDVGHAGVAFVISRRADDLLPLGRASSRLGKALIDCRAARLAAVSM